MPAALVLIDREENIQYINRQAENLFSFHLQAIQGKNLQFLFPGIYQKKSPQFWDSYYENPVEVILTKEDKLTAISNNGKQIPVELKLTPIANGNQSYILAAVTNLSERIQTDDQFRFIFESALHAMVLTDANGVIAMVNRQTELLFGYDRNELIGSKIEILVPDRRKKDHPGHRRDFYKRPKARPMGAGRDLFGVKKDGTEVPLEIGLNPVEKDGANYVLASVIDITARKKSEEAI